jgi:hypothetical protein
VFDSVRYETETWGIGSNYDAGSTEKDSRKQKPANGETRSNGAEGVRLEMISSTWDDLEEQVPHTARAAGGLPPTYHVY